MMGAEKLHKLFDENVDKSTNYVCSIEACGEEFLLEPNS